jgi:hypothetical protein
MTIVSLGSGSVSQRQAVVTGSNTIDKNIKNAEVCLSTKNSSVQATSGSIRGDIKYKKYKKMQRTAFHKGIRQHKSISNSYRQSTKKV